jgi:hypothetical protein
MKPATTATVPVRKRPKARAIARFTLYALAGVFVAWLGFVASRPFLMAQQMGAQNDILERRAMLYERQIKMYERDLKAWDTPEGVEWIARRYGWVKKGEQRLRIVPH